MRGGDDVATSRGPVFAPGFYDRWILPRYERILELPIAGIMYENPVTPFERGRRYPGFVLSSCGGLYGDVPMENLLAYFRTRDRMGIPAEV